MHIPCPRKSHVKLVLLQRSDRSSRTLGGLRAAFPQWIASCLRRMTLAEGPIQTSEVFSCGIPHESEATSGRKASQRFCNTGSADLNARVVSPQHRELCDAISLCFWPLPETRTGSKGQLCNSIYADRRGDQKGAMGTNGRPAFSSFFWLCFLVGTWHEKCLPPRKNNHCKNKLL